MCNGNQETELIKAKISLLFEEADGVQRCYEKQLTNLRRGSEAGEVRLAQEFAADFAVATQDFQPFPHNSTAIGWLTFPSASYDFSAIDDVRNSRELWRELSNLVLAVEHDLADALSYKGLEPPEQPPFEDSDGMNHLHYLHRRKMEYFNRCVYDLIKVQDLVNRLLHEALGGNLVRTDRPEWEQYELNRKNVNKGLSRKVEAGEMPQSDRQLIDEALRIPDETAGIETVVRYRNRLTHHVSPAVDYACFYAKPHSRDFKPLYDESGDITSWSRIFYETLPADYSFTTLHAVYTEYLSAVVTMLDQLSSIPMLHR